MKFKLILFIIFIVVNIAVFTFTEVNKTNNIQVALQNHKEYVENSYTSMKYYQKIVVDNTIDFVRSTSTEILNKLPNASTEERKLLREELYNNLINKYNKIKEKGVSNLLIVLEENKNFLNMSEPNMYDNDLTYMHGVSYVNKTKEPIWGFEKDKTSYAYKYVYPFFNERNQYVGAIEIGFSIEYMHEYFSFVKKTDTHVLIKKSLFLNEELNNNFFEAPENSDYLSFNSSFHQEEVDLEATKESFKEFSQFIKKEMKKDKVFGLYKKQNTHEHHEKEHHEEEQEDEQEEYHTVDTHANDIDVITFFPIKNTNNDTSTWLVFYNLDNFISESLLHVKVFRTASFIILSILLVLLYKVLNQRDSLAKDVEEKTNELDRYFNIINDGIAIADVNTKRFVDCNKAFEELTGYSKKELVTFTIDQIHPKESLDYVFKTFEEQSKTIKSVALDIPILNKDKKVIMTDVSTGSFKKEGKIFNIGIFRNIEDRLELENELKEFNKKLEEKVEIQIKELRQKDNILLQQSKLASMGEMIGNIAHQWRQPLNALGLVMQNIQFVYETDELDDEFIKRSVKKVNLLTSNMSKTIDDFRNFFKPNKEKERFNLDELIKNSFELIESTFEHNYINTEFNIEKTNIEAYGFPNEFSQAFLNILNNAKDALIENEIKDSKVKIRISVDDMYAIVDIEDNAGGIPEDIIENIFNPYFTTKEEGKGTGIGLYMSKSIIEKNMHGKIDVKNSNQGAVFTIRVPLSPSFK